MAKRSSRSTGADADLDEFAWQSPDNADGVAEKKKTKKKKRPSAEVAVVEDSTRAKAKRKSDGKSTGKSAKTTSSAKAASAKSSGKRASREAEVDENASSSVRKKKGSSASGRASGEGDARASGRRRRPPAKKKGVDPIIVISIITVTLLICGGIVYVSRRGTPEQGRNEPAMFDEAKKLHQEGIEAFREWNKAIAEGNGALELQKHKEAHEKLTKALDKLNETLEPYRDPDTGILATGYQGYEDMYSEIAQYLVDLEKSGRVQ